MQFNREDIDRILETVDPVDVLDFCGVTPFSVSSSDIRCGCPIHNGQDPNFSLFYDSVRGKWRFKCFSHSCEKKTPFGSDLIALLMASRGMNFREAVILLSNLSGIELTESEESYLDKKEREYIKECNSQFNTARKYEIETYPEILIDNLVDDGWGILDQYLKTPERNSSLEEVIHFEVYPGLDKTGALRAYIPLHDDRNRLIGITGRVMDTVLEYPPIVRKNGSLKFPPKYDNNPGLKKSGILYNLNRAKKYSKEGIIVVEGQFDAIRMHNYGYPNTVAKMGSILSDKQVALLYKYTTSVILLVEDCSKVDPETGNILSIENKELELEKLAFGMKTSVAYLEKDPDSSSKEEVDKAIKDAELVKNI